MIPDSAACASAAGGERSTAQASQETAAKPASAAGRFHASGTRKLRASSTAMAPMIPASKADKTIRSGGIESAATNAPTSPAVAATAKPESRPAESGISAPASPPGPRGANAGHRQHAARLHYRG